MEITNHVPIIPFAAILLAIVIAYFLFITVVKSWIHKKQILKHQQEIELLTASIRCLLENARHKSPVPVNGGLSYSYNWALTKIFNHTST